MTAIAETLPYRKCGKYRRRETDIMSDLGWWDSRTKVAISGCIEWTASRKKSGGYGQLSFNGEMWSASRFAWVRSFGAIPDGLFVCHRCDNRLCVNSDHLFLGTIQQNNEDMRIKGRAARQFGDRNGGSKLTNDQRRQIYHRALAGERAKQLAAEFGISKRTVYLVIRFNNQI